MSRQRDHSISSLSSTSDSIQSQRSLYTESLVTEAFDLIDWFAMTSYNQYTYTRDDKRISVNLDKVLREMISHGKGCGGDRGRHYAVCSVVACGREEDEDDRRRLLRELGETWLSHVLFVFKANSSHSTSSNLRHSKDATPTWSDTTTALINHQHDRREEVHPEDLKDDGATSLIETHILPLGMATPNSNRPNSKEHSSALTTFNILRQYAGIPVASLEALGENINYPGNGLILYQPVHRGFDHFRWSLQGTNTHEKGIPLPGPIFIRIHHAIACVLHTSGAGKFLSKFIDDFGDSEGGGVVCGDDFVAWQGGHRSSIYAELALYLYQNANHADLILFFPPSATPSTSYSCDGWVRYPRGFSLCFGSLADFASFVPDNSSLPSGVYTSDFRISGLLHGTAWAVIYLHHH
ncbi:hypothetical protein JAAARDRAFT_195707 [Jaapia argillacea MUCL 33604]|uniref:HNH nuclease domain-containing protein n=1 Tax=Jaapia argillacea MUCL 33604 TaxID=933084 RepID=A0A067PK71_9AGAM|nr:hypothetical protein JAAARDRAFT_195707 [Jaapia argillacea MUCL 33604]